jgi:hypothetical protein
VIPKAAEGAGTATAETVTFQRHDLDQIAETLDEVILHGVARWAVFGTDDDEVMEVVRKTGAARLLIRDEIERAEQTAGGAS